LVQSQLALWVIVCIQTSLLGVLAVQFRNQKKGSGLPPGMRIPNVPISTANETQYLRNIAGENKISFILVATKGCQFCEAVLKELAKQYNDQMTPIRILYFGNIDEKLHLPSQIPIYNIDKFAIKRLKVNRFPVGFILDDNSVILRRGIVTVQNLRSWLFVRNQDFPDFTGESA
jgi:hypothetical protein